MFPAAWRLSVRLPSLSKHVDGIDGLQRGITVPTKDELVELRGLNP